MATSPVAGWYADPANSKNVRFWDGTAWSNSTRPVEAVAQSTAALSSGSLDFPETTKKPRSIGTIVAIVAGVGLLAASITVGVVAMSNKDVVAQPTVDAQPSSDQPQDAKPNDTGETHELVIPEGWVSFTSRSGAIEYQRDGIWSDTYTIEIEQIFATAAETPGVEFELAGMWQIDEANLSGPALGVIAGSDGTTARNLRLQTMSFVRSDAQSNGSGDYTTTLDEGYFTPQGYEAWRVDYTYDLYGTPLFNTVIGVMHDTTIVFVYGGSLTEDDSWIEEVATLADTLVIVKAPTGL